MSEAGALPRVTIVVPAYNAAETLAETLASLVTQTYANLEVVVVDDGSRDSTAALARQICEEHPRLLRYVHQANGGQAAAVNNGWKQATGVYLGYLSADDVLYPTALAELVGFLEKNSAIDIVYPDYDLIDATSRVIRRVNAPDFDAHQLVEHSVCQPGPGALFRKSVFESTGGWSTSLRLTPDFDFWVRACRSSELARLPLALAGFRVHEESQTFAAPSEDKSEELPKVIGSFLASDVQKRFRHQRAMAWAHVLSARLHLRGGRRARALTHLRSALASERAVLLHLRFWHLLLSGAFGQLRYRLRYITRKKS